MTAQGSQKPAENARTTPPGSSGGPDARAGLCGAPVGSTSTRTEVVALLTRFRWQLSGTLLTGGELWEHPNGMDELIIPAEGRESAPDAGRLLRGAERVIARAEGPRLLGVVREVAAIHRQDDDGDCWADGDPWPCATVRAMQALTETTKESR